MKKLIYLLIMGLLTDKLAAQVDIKKEKKNTYLDDYGRIRGTLIRQGPASGLNADFFDNKDSWQFLAASGPATFTGTLTATAFVGDGSGLTGISLSGGSTSFIQNTSDLQASSTFYVTSGTVNGQTLLALTSGNVGISTNTPFSKLHVMAGTADGITIGPTTQNLFGGGEIGLLIHSTGTVDFHLVSVEAAEPKITFRMVSNHPLAFNTNNSERMRLTASGRLGISTTNAVNDLSIVGGAFVTSSVTANSYFSLTSSASSSFATNAFSTTSFSDISKAYTQFIVQGGVRSEYRVNASTGRLSECGTAPAFRGNDFAGKITLGTPMSASALCNFKFGAGFADPPICVLTMDNTLDYVVSSVTVTDMTIRSGGGLAAGQKINFVCIDN